MIALNYQSESVKLHYMLCYKVIYHFDIVISIENVTVSKQSHTRL